MTSAPCHVKYCPQIADSTSPHCGRGGQDGSHRPLCLSQIYFRADRPTNRDPFLHLFTNDNTMRTSLGASVLSLNPVLVVLSLGCQKTALRFFLAAFPSPSANYFCFAICTVLAGKWCFCYTIKLTIIRDSPSPVAQQTNTGDDDDPALKLQASFPNKDGRHSAHHSPVDQGSRHGTVLGCALPHHLLDRLVLPSFSSWPPRV